MDATLENLEALYADALLYSDVSWLTSHNSFSIDQEGWTLHPQQHCTIEEQYEFGVHAFMIDVYQDKASGDLVLRHGGETIPGIHKSDKGETYLKDFITGIDKILAKYPKGILTLHIENYVNNVEIAKLITSEVKATNLLHTDPNDNTLTLGKMRANNERLVIFWLFDKFC